MIKPLPNKILARMIACQDKTKSGIILSTKTQDTTQIAKVIDVGSGEKIEDSKIKKGDTLIINKYSGEEIEYEGIKYVLLKVKDVIAIVEY